MRERFQAIGILLVGIVIGVIIAQQCPQRQVTVVEVKRKEVVKEVVEKPTEVTAPAPVTVIVERVTQPAVVTEVVAPPQPVTPPSAPEEQTVVVAPLECPDVELPIKVNFVSTPPKLTNKREVRFRFSYSAKFICEIDGEQRECTRRFSTKLKDDGEKVFKVAMQYLEGCYKELASYTFRLDTTPPETKIIPVGFEKLVTSDTARFKIEVNEPYLSLSCRVDGAFWFECAPTIELTDLTEGWHIVEAFAIDLAGNQEDPPKSFKFRVDAKPPVVKLTSTPPKETTSKVAVFEFEADEPDVVFECDIDNTGWRECSSPFKVENLTPGQHIFKVRGKDFAGRYSDLAVWVWTIK